MNKFLQLALDFFDPPAPAAPVVEITSRPSEAVDAAPAEPLGGGGPPGDRGLARSMG